MAALPARAKEDTSFVLFTEQVLLSLRLCEFSPDALFYMKPRFVKHVDDAFVSKLTDLYRRELRAVRRLLELMLSPSLPG